MAKSARQAQIEKAALYPLDWTEERTGLIGYTKWFLFRNVPRDVNWMQTLGAATLTAFLVQATTGVFLAMYYKPDPDSAYASIQNITNEVTLGWLVRGMHKWGASLFIILMFLHMARTFLFGAYKYPRELNWITGVLLLVTGMAEGFTGYLLPWDQTAYWATVVGININATAPIAGPFIAQFLQGGAQIGPDTLAKFYSLHMLVIPGGLMALIGLHMYLVIRLGVTSPPWSKDAAGRPRDEAAPAGYGEYREGLIREHEDGGELSLASKKEQADRDAFKRYKEDVKKEGKPFFPYAIFHDTVMSLVVVAVIIGLAVIWKFTIDDGEPGALGPLYEAEADPATTNFVPRPDWFFYFLFYLLRIFKWPETVVLGTVGIPTLLLILLLMLPFYDRRPERLILRRPVAFVAAILVVISMGVLTWKGATAKEALGSETVSLVPEWAEQQGFADDPVAVAGATLFAESGCLNCHVYLGAGGQNLGAPDLSEEGAKGRGIEWQVAHLKNPSSKTPGSAMPSFAALGDENLLKIATFLEASKGPQK